MAKLCHRLCPHHTGGLEQAVKAPEISGASPAKNGAMLRCEIRRCLNDATCSKAPSTAHTTELEFKVPPHLLLVELVTRVSKSKAEAAPGLARKPRCHRYLSIFICKCSTIPTLPRSSAQSEAELETISLSEALVFVLGGGGDGRLQSNPPTPFGFGVNYAVWVHFFRGWRRDRKCLVFIMFFSGCQ